MENCETTVEKKKSSSDTRESSSSENIEISNEQKSKQTSSKKSKKNKRKSKLGENSSECISLYVTSCEKDIPTTVTPAKLKEAIPNLNLVNTIETEYGLILNLSNDTFVDKILKMNLARIFGKPVQVVPLCSSKYRKTVSFKDIPWCIRNEELDICLKKQGIKYGKLTREKSTLYVEVSNFPDYQRLREEGINFYDSVVFRAVEDVGLNEEIQYNNDNIIQCYKCQGFWHTANTCKQNVRCVRCGEEHLVEMCNRPKNSPICCNCKGPHHAAYKLCPVRLKLKKSVRVSFAFNQ
ncbi:hypothetical protein JTB14_000326 [Gonioctena quinquepunctata]|nr:hypothetical protein JTB14_000326 [Gonioctena quinquepunctata]